MKLNMEKPCTFLDAARKVFAAGERHITRVCRHDVLILMEEGHLFFSEDGTAIELEAGQYYIQRRGLLQQGLIPSDTAKYTYLHFLGEYTEDRGLPLFGSADMARLAPIYGHLTRLEFTGGSYLEKCADFYRILSLLYSGGRETERDPVAWLALAFSAEPRRRLSLDEIARGIGYSKNQTIMIFKERTGMTPYGYLQSLRLCAARRMLADSSLPVGAVADECGFGSYINFYKAFVASYGLTPTVWREKSRE